MLWFIFCVWLQFLLPEGPQSVTTVKVQLLFSSLRIWYPFVLQPFNQWERYSLPRASSLWLSFCWKSKLFSKQENPILSKRALSCSAVSRSSAWLISFHLLHGILSRKNQWILSTVTIESALTWWTTVRSDTLLFTETTKANLNCYSALLKEWWKVPAAAVNPPIAGPGAPRLPGCLLPPVCNPPGSGEVGRPSMPIWPWLTGDEVTPNSPYPLIAPDGLAKWAYHRAQHKT